MHCKNHLRKGHNKQALAFIHHEGVLTYYAIFLDRFNNINNGRLLGLIILPCCCCYRSFLLLLSLSLIHCCCYHLSSASVMNIAIVCSFVVVDIICMCPCRRYCRYFRYHLFIVVSIICTCHYHCIVHLLLLLSFVSASIGIIVAIIRSLLLLSFVSVVVAIIVGCHSGSSQLFVQL